MSIVDFQTGEEFRWTSLPRVSNFGKRPDHVIQFSCVEEGNTLLAIESKDMASKMSDNLGVKLTNYVKKLLETPPIATKTTKAGWQLWQTKDLPITNLNILI